MAIWAPIAAAEFAILDLLGHVSGRSVHDLLGKRVRSTIDVYWANNFRGHSAEDSVRQIVDRYEKERPPAVKVKVAGRMGRPEEPPGRTERMLPMLREALGDDVVIYADANGGYDVQEAIRIGHMLEELTLAFSRSRARSMNCGRRRKWPTPWTFRLQPVSKRARCAASAGWRLTMAPRCFNRTGSTMAV